MPSDHGVPASESPEPWRRLECSVKTEAQNVARPARQSAREIEANGSLVIVRLAGDGAYHRGLQLHWEIIQAAVHEHSQA